MAFSTGIRILLKLKSGNKNPCCAAIGAIISVGIFASIYIVGIVFTWKYAFTDTESQVLVKHSTTTDIAILDVSQIPAENITIPNLVIPDLTIPDLAISNLANISAEDPSGIYFKSCNHPRCTRFN